MHPLFPVASTTWPQRLQAPILGRFSTATPRNDSRCVAFLSLCRAFSRDLWQSPQRFGITQLLCVDLTSRPQSAHEPDLDERHPSQNLRPVDAAKNSTPHKWHGLETTRDRLRLPRSRSSIFLASVPTMPADCRAGRASQ
jgi:hypothetical protein